MVRIDSSGVVYSVKLSDEELAQVTRALEAKGLHNGSVGDSDLEAESETFEPKAWAHGTDNRSVLGINEYPISSSGDAVLYQRIGQLSSGCTGTLIGSPETDEYFFLTAAHCLFSEVTGNYLAPTISPRRDSCKNKLGSSLTSCDTKPYGEWPSAGALTYQAYLDDCRFDPAGSNDCISFDIAIVRITRPSGESYPGAFGFGSYSNSFIKDRTNYLRGYPNCRGDGDPDAPGGCASSTSVCRSNTLYGASGDMGDTYNNGRRSKFGIDGSAGQSGSGIYLNDGGNHRIFAVYSAESTGCFDGCNQNRPNHGARITSTFYGYMLDFMGI